jgi:hypothetical protein
MKKLQFLALAMLLSTGFISSKELTKDEKNEKKATKAAVIGNPPTQASIVAFVNSATQAFSSVASPSQADAQTLQTALKDAIAAIKQIYPKADKSSPDA